MENKKTNKKQNKYQFLGNLDIPERTHGFQFFASEDEYAGDTVVLSRREKRPHPVDTGIGRASAGPLPVAMSRPSRASKPTADHTPLVWRPRTERE